jgi:hypothetical protein
MTTKGAVPWDSLWRMGETEFDWLYEWSQEHNEKIEQEIEKARSAARKR